MRMHGKRIIISTLFIACSLLSACEEPASVKEADIIHQKAQAYINGVPEEEIPLDLTMLPGKVKCSKLLEMISNPDEYVTRKIIINGSYSYVKDSNTGQEYHSCVVSDEEGLNIMAIEFDPENKEDLPAAEEDITVEGYYDIYREGDTPYATLRYAHILNSNIAEYGNTVLPQ